MGGRSYRRERSAAGRALIVTGEHKAVRRALPSIPEAIASNPCGGVGEFRISRDIALALRPSSMLAGLGQLSPWLVLSEALAAIEVLAAKRSLVGDWLALAVDRQGDGVDVDVLFLDFHRFCDALNLPHERREPYAQFVKALGVHGLRPVEGAGGRMRCGQCRLLGASFDPVKPPVADMDAFLGEVCEDHGPHVSDRARATELRGAYDAWAKRAGLPRLTVRSFAAAMTAAGFERVQSNGIWWRGVKLRSAYAASPRPLPNGGPTSGMDGGCKPLL